MKRFLFRILVAVVSFLMVGHGIFGVTSAFASTAPAPAVAPLQDNSGCPPAGESGWTKVESSSLDGYPVEGADAYCFKAGPYVIDYVPEGGFGQEGACTEDHVERCGLSHWGFHKPKATPTKTPVTPTPTNTPVPPTSTDTPVPPTPTNTPVPPTATDTPGPGTPTNTPDPGTPTPTNTSVPPTATQESPTATPHPVDKEPPATAATVPYLPINGAWAEIALGLVGLAIAWRRQ